MRHSGLYSFQVKFVLSSEFETFRTASKQDVRFMGSVENSAVATSFLLVTYGVY